MNIRIGYFRDNKLSLSRNREKKERTDVNTQSNQYLRVLGKSSTLHSTVYDFDFFQKTIYKE